MKFRRLFKKAAAALMAAVTALSVLPATTAFAAGDIGTISFTHTYDSSGNTMRYNSSAVFDGYTAGGTGKYKYRMFVDGENAFCIQPGVPLKTGNTLKKASSDTWNALSTNQKKAVGLALLYGYQGNRSHLSGSDDEKWLATQTLVWEFVTGCREATGSYQQNSTKDPLQYFLLKNTFHKCPLRFHLHVQSLLFLYMPFLLLISAYLCNAPLMSAIISSAACLEASAKCSSPNFAYCSFV